MNDLQTRVRNYLESRKPRAQAKVTPEVKPEGEPVVIYLDRPDNPIVILFKLGIVSVGIIVVIWALVVVGTQNRCYLDKACRTEIERVNR